MRRLRTRLRTAGSGPFPGSALFINFSAGSTLDSRVTFSRGTNATLVDSTGKITYAPANLLLQSQDFDTASWSKTRTTVTANATVAPDGTSTADKLVEDTTASSTHFTAQSANYTAGTTYTLSVSVKAAGRNWFDIQLPAALMGTIRNAFFDVSNGTVGTVTSGVTAAIVSIGNGWYRCSVKFTPTASVGTGSAFLLANADNSISYTGDGTSGIFIWGAQLEPVTYQTTPSTYNVTTSAAYYGPRFDYDPVTLAAKGLLIEEARTNLFTYSDQFDNAAWTKANATITANTTASPDGTTNADKLVEDTATSVHTVATGSITATANSFYAFTIYAKASGRDFIQINFSNLILSGNVWDVDLAANTITFVSAGAGWSNVAGSITNAGNGWRRISVSGQVGATISAVGVTVRLASSPSTISYTGNGTSGAFLYGAQLEAGAFATSYIPTVASTVTRSADVATMTGTNFSSWYNQSEGTLFADASTLRPSAVSTVNFITMASDGTTSERTQIGFSDATIFAGARDGGVLQADILSAITIAQPCKAALAYRVNDFAASFNGGTVGTDTLGTLPTVDRLTIGSGWTGSNFQLNGHIRQIAYYNTRLPNAQLQALTAPSMVTTLSLDFINGVYDA